MSEAGLDEAAEYCGATAGKRRGRPRAASTHRDEQRAAILRAAARLFREQEIGIGVILFYFGEQPERRASCIEHIILNRP